MALPSFLKSYVFCSYTQRNDFETGARILQRTVPFNQAVVFPDLNHDKISFKGSLKIRITLRK